MTQTARTGADACLGEDDLLALASGALADMPAAEAHLATCATCSALLAGVVRASPATRAWDALAGSTLGPYRIDAQIGAGGMGAVYRAWDPRLGRAIAIKVLHSDGAARTERLAVEARAAAAIDHRAVVGIHDVGVADGMHYVAMELVEGESLRSVLAGPALGLDRTRELAIELADALAAAHARGVIHRDLKPENLILARGGLKILDFGLAKLVDAAPLDETEPGTVQGTAGYMAPEQARGEPADARADIFAVGAIVYELAAGRRAFPGATHADRLSATLRDTPPTDELGALGPVVGRCLAKEPRDRFQTAADLAWTLRALAPPRKRPTRRVFLAGIAGAAAAGAGGFLVGRRARGRAAVLPEPRMLTHRTGRVYTARFSHDGARAVYGAAWDLEPVGVHVLDFATGETTVPDLPSADLLAVSARGELAINLGVRFVDHQSARGELATVPLAGGELRRLGADVQDADFIPEDPARRRFTGDIDKLPAGALVATRPAGRGFRIEHPIGNILVAEAGWITHVRMSPDGKSLAYLRHPHPNDDAGALVLVDIATGAPRIVTTGWATIAGLAWDPDGDALWFTAALEGLHATLHHTTLDGTVTQVQGPTANRLRVHDVATDPAGDARDRRLLGTLDAWRLRAMAGDRDRSLSEVSYVADLSPDGEQVLIGELGRPEASLGAYLASYATGRRVRIGPGFPVAFSPSGRRIAANVRDTTRLVIYSTTSSDAPSMPAPGFVTYARWIDERSLVALFEEKLWRLSLDGPPVVLTDTGGEFAIDPARTRCAYIDKKGDKRALRVLDLASGVVRVLAEDWGGGEVCGWLAEPDAIAVRSSTAPIVVERIDPATGARSPHVTIQPPVTGLKGVDAFIMHAGGARYAYSYGQELSQLFVMPIRA